LIHRSAGQAGGIATRSVAARVCVDMNSPLIWLVYTAAAVLAASVARRSFARGVSDFQAANG